ncbi:MAG: polyprenol monophosphomannose synthase [Beutenbergiaceae bacterium]
MKAVVIIPTYNEREALPHTVDRLRRTTPELDILVVDDASPDGTGQWADQAATTDSQLHVLHRARKEGLGPAYLAGFAWALAREYTHLVEMDADGSHRAQDLPRLLRVAEHGADLVIGSRWVPGGRVVNWPWHRQLISRAGTGYARLALGLEVRDATAGFRVYRAQMLRELPLDEVESQGYCFQIDMTWRIWRSGGRIVEVPISFVERTLGESKMNRAIAWEAMTRLTQWGIDERRRRLVDRLQALRRRA